MSYLEADKLWAIPAGLAALFCMVCLLPALAVVYVFTLAFEKLSGEQA